MITLLRKGYNKERYAWLNEILAEGFGTATGKRDCHYHSAECKVCDNRVVCNDTLRLMRFLGGEIHSAKTNGHSHNASDTISSNVRGHQP